jgi:hypothetical protein
MFTREDVAVLIGQIKSVFPPAPSVSSVPLLRLAFAFLVILT